MFIGLTWSSVEKSVPSSSMTVHWTAFFFFRGCPWSVWSDFTPLPVRRRLKKRKNFDIFRGRLSIVWSGTHNFKHTPSSYHFPVMLKCQMSSSGGQMWLIWTRFWIYCFAAFVFLLKFRLAAESIDQLRNFRFKNIIPDKIGF